MARGLKTVETVSDRALYLDHRAEAAVLMRSLRVAFLRVLPKVEFGLSQLIALRSCHVFIAPDGATRLCVLPRLDADDEVADGNLLIGHYFGALFTRQVTAGNGRGVAAF